MGFKSGACQKERFKKECSEHQILHFHSWRLFQNIPLTDTKRFPFIVLKVWGKLVLLRHFICDHVVQLASETLRRPHRIEVEGGTEVVVEAPVDAFKEVPFLGGRQDVAVQAVILQFWVRVDEESEVSLGSKDCRGHCGGKEIKMSQVNLECHLKAKYSHAKVEKHLIMVQFSIYSDVVSSLNRCYVTVSHNFALQLNCKTTREYFNVLYTLEESSWLCKYLKYFVQLQTGGDWG